MSILYIKKAKDIALTGHTFDEITCLDMERFSSMDFGNSQRDYQLIDRIGNGSIVRGGQNYTQRKMSASFNFINPVSAERFDFLSKWVHSYDDKYLYRDNGVYLERVKVYPNTSNNEVWNNLVMSEDMKIDLLLESPFFTSVVSTVLNYSLTTTTTNIPITLNGIAAPMVIEYIFNYFAGTFSAKTYENVGIVITSNFNPLATLKIETNNLKVFINGQERFVDAYYSFTGSPFRLETGDNILTIITPALGDLTITYYERRT